MIWIPTTHLIDLIESRKTNSQFHLNEVCLNVTIRVGKSYSNPHVSIITID